MEKQYFDPCSDVTQNAIDGIKFDFNDGFRVKIPTNLNDTYRIVLKDKFGVSFFDTEINVPKIKKMVNSDFFGISFEKKYFIEYDFYIYKNDKLEFRHQFNLKNKKVFIELAECGLGDFLAWIEPIDKFRKFHSCQLFVNCSKSYETIIANHYKEINFIDGEIFDPYASYHISTNPSFPPPVEMHICGVRNYIHHYLGLDLPSPTEENKPKLDLSKERQFKKPYVCIGPFGSALMKMWTYPNGWETVVKYLKEKLGYDVYCIGIDKESVFIDYTQKIPEGCIDLTGDISLQKRIDIIKDADFFIGLSSGLSWLAWACNIPVVMISGFSYDTNEFYTPYRVSPIYDCKFCFNKSLKTNFKNFEYDTIRSFCPEHFKNSASKKFECHHGILPEMVIEKINQIPCVKEKLNDK